MLRQRWPCVVFLPWYEDGIVEEVLKDFAIVTVLDLCLQVLIGLGTGAAGALVRSAGVGLGGLGVLLHLRDSGGRNADGDLQLCV